MSETDQEPKRSWSIKQIFLILDEASGISDKAINILTGALTEKDNRMLMMSQPTRPSGYFYDSHHKNAKSELKWSTKTGHRVRVFSSIDFPIRLVVTHHYIRAVLGKVRTSS